MTHHRVRAALCALTASIALAAPASAAGSGGDPMTLDTNADGRIDAQEFLDHHMTRIDETLAARFRALDTDRDGAISRHEYLHEQSRRLARQLIERFEAADRDGDGAIALPSGHTHPWPPTPPSKPADIAPEPVSSAPASSPHKGARCGTATPPAPATKPAPPASTFAAPVAPVERRTLPTPEILPEAAGPPIDLTGSLR